MEKPTLAQGSESGGWFQSATALVLRSRQEDRQPEFAGIRRAIALGVIHRRDIHLSWPQLRIRNRHHRIAPFVDRSHQSGLAFFQRIHRHARKGETHHAIDEVRTTRTQIVSQVADHGLFTGCTLDLVAQVLGHTHLFAMPECVGLAIFLHRVALPFGTFRKDGQRIVARIVSLVLNEQLDQMLEIDRIFGNATAHGGHVRRIQSGITRVAAEHPENTDPLVRSHRGTLTIDRVHGEGNRGRESNAVLGVADIVVHRLRHREYFHPLAIELRGIAQRVIAANRDQVVESERFDILQYRRSHIVDHAGYALLGRFIGFELLALQGGRQLFHLRGIRTRAVQKSSAGAIDRTRVLAIEWKDVPRLASRIVPIEVGETLPPSPDSHDLASDFGSAVNHRFDDGVQSRDVTASGEYAYTPICHIWITFMYEEVIAGRFQKQTPPSDPRPQPDQELAILSGAGACSKQEGLLLWSAISGTMSRSSPSQSKDP